jgi:phosphatidylserine/phosphatidylglycerophosphate/cardiolipin synthase-like enzyme
MTLFLYDTFLRDLHSHGDGTFAQRVIRKIVNPNGSFRADNNDHRYDGIDNAWIRYVSGGASAYRAIYIREGEDVYLYRAGEHSVEDGLEAPKGARSLVPLADANIAPSTASVPSVPSGEPETLFRQNGRGRLLRSFLLGRRLFPHKEVIIVSPYLAFELFQRTHRVGQVLDQLKEEGAQLTLITRPPVEAEYDTFRDLEVRGWDVLFHKSLHSKVYIFKVDGEARYVDQGAADAALIGSANFTAKGFGFDEHNSNEELCYELPKGAHDSVLDYTYQIALQSQKLDRIRRKSSAKRI